MPVDIDRAKYISFVSRRRDGTPVPTAVWVVPFEDGYAFTTDPDSWKVKRIARDPAVTIQASNVRGKPRTGAPVHAGRAEVLDDAKVATVREVVRAKYPIAYRLLISWSERRAARRDGSPTAGTAAIKVVLDA